MVMCIGGLCASHIITALFCIWLKFTLADVNQEIGVLVVSNGNINYYNVSDVGLDGRLKSYKQLITSYSYNDKWIWALDYHWDKKLVFGSDHKGIYRTSFKEYAQPAETLLKADGVLAALGVDWMHDRLIFPIRNGSLWQGRGLAIVSTDLHGGNLTVLLTRPTELGVVRGLRVDPYAGKIFWFMWFGLYIESCNLDGTEFKSINPNMSIVHMSPDLPTRKVFLVDSMDSLYSMDYTGENLRKHWTVTKTPVGFDVLDGTVYWFNNINGQFIFYKLDTNQSILPEKLFFTDEPVYYQMRIVHPSVQEKPCSSGRWTYYDCVTTTEQSDTSTTESIPAVQENLHSSGIWTYYDSITKIKHYDTSTTESVQASVTVTDTEKPPTTLMPLNTRQSTHSPNDTQRGQENATSHPTHTLITVYVVVFNALVSVVLLGLVVFVIRKYHTQRHNELSIANVIYNPSGADNLYEPCRMP